jgi:hypothetical protein
MPTESDFFRHALCDALVVLALPPAEQVRVNGPGCVSCDLLEDFNDAMKGYCQYFNNEMTDPQANLLVQIDRLMDSMQEADYECFNNDVLDRPVWQQLRSKAAAALQAFGWEAAVVQPFIEVEPGVWKRTPHKP